MCARYVNIVCWFVTAQSANGINAFIHWWKYSHSISSLSFIRLAFIGSECLKIYEYMFREHFLFQFFTLFFFFALVFFVFILNYWHKMASLFIRSGCKSFYSSQRYLLSISFLLFLCFLVVFFSSTIPFGSSCLMVYRKRAREHTHKKYQEICYAWERDVI